MKIIKKIFNKVLFAIIVALVFSFINRCNVKALTGTNLTYGIDYDIYKVPVDSLDNTWQLVGRTITDDYRSWPFNFLINRNNKSLIGVALPNAEYLNVIEFYDFDINNFALFSSTVEGGNKLMLTESQTMPVLGGNCESGNFCYNFINSGSQGNGYSATIYGDTIYIDLLGIVADNNVKYTESNTHYFYPYGRKMICSDYINGCYIGTASPSSQWSVPNQANLNTVYFVSQKFHNNANYEAYNQIVVEREDPVINVNYNIDFVTIDSSDNSQEEYGNDMTITSVATAIKYSPCDSELYNYYYDFIPSGDTQHVMDWKQVTDNKCIGSYNVKENGTLVGLITDKQDNQLYVKNFAISKVGTLSTFSVNNNKFSTFLTDISSNISYGGPISGLTTIPINLMSTLYNSFSGTCSAYNLGSILGHNIVINCFTLESILGSSITGVIDMLCAFGIYYHLVLLIISIYRKVMNLDDLDDYLPQHMYHPQHGSYEDLHS